jgi:hypothetical protein
MARTCCGYEQATKFCAHCGTALMGHDLATLRSYVNARVKMREQVLQKTKQGIRGRPSKKDSKKLAMMQSHLNKWKDWLDAIDAVLPVSEEADPEELASDQDQEEDADDDETGTSPPWASGVV